MVENAQSWPEFELKHFTTPYMQLPLPAVFHDKTKRTQQGNLSTNLAVIALRELQS